MTRKLLALLVGLMLMGAYPAWPAGAQAGCEFKFGFRTLRDLLASGYGRDIVGACYENEQFEPSTGNSLQRTVGGLMVWRKADNWTAFSDGATTWINGPEGLASRPNAGPLFSWEAAAPPATAPLPAPTAPPAPVTPAVPTVVTQVSPWIGDIRFGIDPSGNGALPSGGKIVITPGITVYGFFNYRDIAAGSTITMIVLQGKEVWRSVDFRPTGPQGSNRIGLFSVSGSGGGGRWTGSPDYSLVVSVNGTEFARGYVLIE